MMYRVQFKICKKTPNNQKLMVCNDWRLITKANDVLFMNDDDLNCSTLMNFSKLGEKRVISNAKSD